MLLLLLLLLLLQLAVQEQVLGLAWAGKSLLLAVPGGYQVVRPVLSPAQQGQQPGAAPGPATLSYQLQPLADHLSSISPRVGSIPQLGLGLMLWEENMVLVTDAAGELGHVEAWHRQLCSLPGCGCLTEASGFRLSWYRAVVLMPCVWCCGAQLAPALPSCITVWQFSQREQPNLMQGGWAGVFCLVLPVRLPSRLMWLQLKRVAA